MYMFVLFEIICALDQFINLCHVSGHTDHEIESESTHAARRQSETSEVDYGSWMVKVYSNRKPTSELR